MCTFQDDAVSSLVLGTENSQLLVLDPTATQVLHTWQLKHVPAFLCIKGKLIKAMHGWHAAPCWGMVSSFVQYLKP